MKTLLFAAIASLCVSWQLSAQQRASAADSGRRAVRQGRLVGVFDAVSGAPLEGVEVKNMTNGLSALTTNTGTLSLFFVDTSGSLIRFRKLGYQPVVAAIANSLRDTTPITVVLSPVAQTLPALVTRGHRDAADTIRKLIENGFYDRRYATAAPSSAFVTAERLDHLVTLRDLRSVTGREICYDNLFLDGVPFIVAGSGGALSSPIESVISKDMIAGIEQFEGPEIPAEYNGTRRSGATNTCATLIWTK